MEPSGGDAIEHQAKELTITRREALQGLAGVAAAAVVPLGAVAEKSKKPAAFVWPEDAAKTFAPISFTEDWRFYRGDAPGAEAAAFDDSAWRALGVPHDWSIEDLPEEPGGDGAIWSQGINPLRTGPFDVYASEGQISTGWRSRLVSQIVRQAAGAGGRQSRASL